MKPPKGKRKGDKTPCDSSSTASKLLPLLDRWQLKQENPFSLIFRLYRQQFLDCSVKNGLMDPAHLALAGDGTPIRAIFSVTTSTCMWPPIPIAISLYFRFWKELPGMICFLFYTLFSP